MKKSKKSTTELIKHIIVTNRDDDYFNEIKNNLFSSPVETIIPCNEDNNNLIRTMRSKAGPSFSDLSDNAFTSLPFGDVLLKLYENKAFQYTNKLYMEIMNSVISQGNRSAPVIREYLHTGAKAFLEHLQHTADCNAGNVKQKVPGWVTYISYIGNWIKQKEETKKSSVVIKDITTIATLNADNKFGTDVVFYGLFIIPALTAGDMEKVNREPELPFRTLETDFKINTLKGGLIS